MTQRKKSAYRETGAPQSYPARPAAGRKQYGKQVSARSDGSRRTVTFVIVLSGILIAIWVLMASLGQDAGGTTKGATASSAANDQKAVDSAAAALQDQLRQNPNDVAAMISLGNTYYDAERYAEAVPWYTKALESQPNNTDVRTDLGTAYFYSDNPVQAKEQWARVLEQDSNKVQAHFNLGVLYSHSTPPDLDSATREWETVIKIAPQSEQAKSAAENLKNLGKR